jgi:hypothetical protein
MHNQAQPIPDAEEEEEFPNIEEDLPWLAESKRRINEDIKDLSPEETAAYFRARSRQLREQMPAQQVAEGEAPDVLASLMLNLEEHAETREELAKP